MRIRLIKTLDCLGAGLDTPYENTPYENFGLMTKQNEPKCVINCVTAGTIPFKNFKTGQISEHALPLGGFATHQYTSIC